MVASIQIITQGQSHENRFAFLSGAWYNKAVISQTLHRQHHKKAVNMSNTKTRRNIFLAVIAVVVVAVLLLAGTVFLTHNFIWYEKGYHPDPDSWVGLTREEILDLAFKEFPICRRGGLHVKAWNIDAMGIEGEWSSYYFKTPKDAKADSKFMKYDCWMADIQKAIILILKQESKLTERLESLHMST